jgi:hypothetical protein
LYGKVDGVSRENEWAGKLKCFRKVYRVEASGYKKWKKAGLFRQDSVC